MLTAEILRSTLKYDEETGVFTRNGKPVGTRTKNGYIVVRILNRLQYAHRLAWLYVHGEFPKDDIDHANGVRQDNRIANLREATRSQNIAAKRGRNVTGFKGVMVHRDERRSKRFGASVTKDGQQHFLGWFATAREAGEAYATAAKRIHGEFAK